MRKLFISYPRENRRDVDQLVEHLRLMGYDTWVDSELRGGQDWWEEVLRRIADSDVFIAIISPAALISTACQRECDWAEALARPVLPVAVEPTTAALPGRFARRQIVDYSQPQQRERAALMLQGGLGSVPAARPLPDPLPDPPAVPLSYLIDLVDLVVHPKPLHHAQQHEVLQQLGVALRSVDPEERRGGRDILERFASRIDVYADVDRSISALRQFAEETSRIDPREAAEKPGSPPDKEAADASEETEQEPEHQSQTDAMRVASAAPAESATEAAEQLSAAPMAVAQGACGTSIEQELVPGATEGEQLAEQTAPQRDQPDGQVEVKSVREQAASDPTASEQPTDATPAPQEVRFFQRLNRRTKVVLAVVAASAVAAVALVIINDRSDPTRRLLALAGSDNCSPTQDNSPPAGAVATVSCDVDALSGGTYYYLFSDRATLDNYFNGQGYPSQSCTGVASSPSPQTWHDAAHTLQQEGRVDCFVNSSGEPVVSWTVDAQLLYGRAVGPQGGTIDKVSKWWADHMLSSAKSKGPLVVGTP